MTNLSALALIVGLLGVGLGGYALLQTQPADDGIELRLATLEDEIGRLQGLLEEREPERGPTLLGMSPEAPPSAPGGIAPTVRAGSTEVADGPMARADLPDGAADGETKEEIAVLVDKAVAKKAEQMLAMRNKKPSLDVFAQTLELSDGQREAAAREVARSQHEIRSVLETPAEDGTIFLDELVDVMAHGMANPGKNTGRWQKLFSRLTTERVPGTDQTYAARAEEVKQGLRDTFKRSWTPKQYATFESWRMDPTEVQGVPGSAWEDLKPRLLDRARDLGAKIPEDGAPR